MSHKEYFEGMSNGEKFAIAYGIVNDFYKPGCAAEILADHAIDAKELYEFYLKEVVGMPDYEYLRFAKLFKKEEV